MFKENTVLDERARTLLNLVATGNQQAYEDLYRLMSSRVYAFARRMINNAETAEEVLADTMYDVWRTAVNFRGDSKVSTWILGIARNKALMALRSAKTHGHEGSEDIDDFADILDSGAPDGFDQLAEKQASEMIQRCLERLSGKHRECLHLIHFEDLSMKEVAMVQGIPEGTIKSRLSHARAQMAACVEATQRRLAIS
ncbi:MAG: sigma-70 family RNA polymerase sigma factor [Pseudomonadota bacterium]